MQKPNSQWVTHLNNGKQPKEERIDSMYKEDENSKRGAAKFQFVVRTSKQN
jgi:hypothetical protein